MSLEELARLPMLSEKELRMVEIIMLKWRCPDVEMECARRIIANTEWPFKLVAYDNRLNTPNTARIWNKLIRAATCDYVCLIDSDAFVPESVHPGPCWLERMMDTFDEFQDCRIVLPLTNRCANPEQKSDGPLGEPAAMRATGVWSGFCFLMRKSLIEEVGQFDEEFIGYGQDSEFAVRLVRNGGGAYIRRDVFVEHVHGASFKAATEQGIYNGVADRAYAQELYLRKTAQ